METVTVLYATAPDEATAENIAVRLVEDGGAACGNIIPGLRSIYRWVGEIRVESEFVLIVKTAGAAAERAKSLIEATHPYEVPAIIALCVDQSLSSGPYCRWLKNSCLM